MLLFEKIRFFGVDTPTGVGTHCTETMKALSALQIENIQIELIKHNYIDQVQAAISTSSDSDVNIFFFPEVYVKNLKGTKIYWCVFESSRPNPGYEEWLQSFNFIFATSQWGRKAMLEFGMDGSKIFVIPEGVDHRFYNPFGRSLNLKGIKTKFLMVGKYEHKKGYQEAFESLRIASELNPNLELHTKSDWINGVNSVLHPEFLELVKQYQNKFKISVYSGILSREQMRWLYYSCDYFLHPSRCEGWSLPLIEALACGTPCLSTLFGGHSEYLDFLPEANKIKTTLKPVDCLTYKEAVKHTDGDWGQWAYADVNELARQILNSAAFANSSDSTGSDYVRRFFSWDLVAEKILGFLRTQSQRPISTKSL
jgi:glycosyltransferase involved in cell wall biosynthesis